MTAAARTARLRAMPSREDSSHAWRDAMPLFEQWLALPETGRAALLAQLGQAQPLQHARLQQLIDADRQAESLGFLDTPASLLPEEQPQRSGLRLGAWQLQEQVGSGGMGEVWRAVRSDGLYSGQAAVKLQRTAQAHPLADARFAREGEFLARVSHPHVAQLLDAGVTAQGTRYLVLEYVQGERIDTWCDRSRLDVEARLALFLQLCAAVAFAHAQQVAHRDLKPSNVLVTAQGHVKLLDFGVAKLLGDAEGATELTRASAAGLTPEYAAPEQVEGQAVTMATDVYALGVLLFLLLAGQRPYGHAGSTAAQLARDIVEAEPLQLSAAVSLSAAEARASTPHALRRRLRGDLERIVGKALQKSPALRYASAQALADDIGRHLRHEPVLARAPTLGYRLARWARRQRVPLAAAAVLALALATGGGEAAAAAIALAVLVGVAATLWQARQARHQARLARAEAAKANAIKDFLLGVFQHTAIGHSDAQARQDTTARELLEAGGARLLGDTALPAALRGELLTTLAQLHDDLGLVTSAGRLSAAAVQAACRSADDSSAACIEALVVHAHSLSRLGETEASNAAAHDALARAHRSVGKPQAAIGTALYVLGYNEHQAGRMEAALQHLGQAAELFAHHEPQHSMRIDTLMWLGNTHIVREDFDAAIATFRGALPLADAQPTLRDYSAGALHQALADALSSAGWLAECMPHRDLAIELSARALGQDHPNVWMMRVGRGRFRHQLGQVDAGREEVNAAIAAARDDTMPSAGNLRDRIAVAQAMMALDEGDIGAALALNGPLLQRYANSGAQTLGSALMRQAEAAGWLGNHAAASAAGRRALELMDSQIGPDTIRAKQARVVLAEALARNGADLATGEAHIEEASRLFEQVLMPAPADQAAVPPPALQLQRARARVGLAELALARADPASALPWARAALVSLDTGTPVLRERLVRGQARWVEARALQALGQVAQAQAACADAAAQLRACQVAPSPRLFCLCNWPAAPSQELAPPP